MRRPFAFLVLCLAALAACDSPSGTRSLPPAVLTVVSGDQQTDTVGRELAQPLVVQVLDSLSQPVAGQIVNFVVVAGGGRVFAGASQTNAQGEAQERWTLGTVAGDTQRLEVRAVDPSTGAALVFAEFRAFGVPDAPASLTAVGATTRSGPSGGAVADSLAVRLADTHGNPIAGATVAWSGDGAVAPASSPTDAGGVAKAQWTLAPTTSPQQAQATTGTLTPVAFIATPSAPTGLILEVVSGADQTAPVTNALAAPLVVRVLLPGGVPLEGAQVAWTATSGRLAPTTSSTGADGLAQASWTLGTAAGAQTATANSSGAGATFAATAEPGAAVAIVKVAGDGQTAPLGQRVAQNPTVTVRDVHGNAVGGVTIQWTRSGGGTVAAAAASAGQAAVTWALGNRLDVAQTLTASAAGLTPVSFTATPTLAGSGVTLARTAGNDQTIPFETTAPEALEVTATLPDGRPVIAAPVTWFVRPCCPTSIPTVAPRAAATDADGRIGAVVTSYTRAGSYEIEASFGSDLRAVFALTVPSGSVANIYASLDRDFYGRTPAYYPYPMPIVGGDVTVRVRMVDADGNLVTGTPLTLTPSPGGGTIKSVTPINGDDPRVEVVWTLGTDLDLPIRLTMAAGGVTRVFDPEPVSDHTVGADARPAAVEVAVGDSVLVAPSFVDQYGNGAANFHRGQNYYVESTIADSTVATFSRVLIAAPDSGGFLYHPRVVGQTGGSTTLTMVVRGYDTYGNRVTHTVVVPVVVSGP